MIGLLQPDSSGNWVGTIRLIEFSSWGTRWQFSGQPDDRDATALSGVFPLTCEASLPSSPPSEEQFRAATWLATQEQALSIQVAEALLSHLQLFLADGAIDLSPLPWLNSMAGVQETVLLQAVEICDPSRGPRYRQNGVAVMRLSFACQWCEHTDSHGLEVVAGVAGVAWVGDQWTF